MKRLKGFTVLELMVAMVISSLVISAAYLTLSFIDKRLVEYKKVGENISQAVNLSAAINNDVNNCKFIYKTPGGMELKFRMEPSSRPPEDAGTVDVYSTISYSFGSEYVMREVRSLVDTFFVVGSRVDYLLNGNSVSAGALLNALLIRIKVNGQEREYIVKKEYSAEEQMAVENS